MTLTKDTDKMLCLIYREYLNRRKSDIPKSEAVMFEHPSMLQTQFLQDYLEDDINSTILELKKNDLIKAYIDNSFRLNDSLIVYMENRFKNGLKEVVDFLSKIL